MKKILLAIGIGLAGIIAPLFAANAVSDDAEAKYTQAIEGRTADILNALALSDTNKAAKVHDIIIAQYRALNVNDDKMKASPKDTNVLAQVHATRKVLHREFLSKLSENLTPQQIDIVKDKMTYGKVKVTYDAYCEIIPTLTDEQKAKILEWLKEAREEAMDGGSANEKSAIFKIYKGKIANYLSKEGVDENKARKEWSARQKEKAAAMTNDVASPK